MIEGLKTKFKNDLRLYNIIDRANQIIGPDLSQLNDLIKLELKSQDQLTQEICDYILSSQGKRIRPILVILANRLFNQNPDEELRIKSLYLASAIELIHTATLLHDDVVDNSDLRRGIETIKAKFGNKEAILLGDYLFSSSFVLMTKANNIAVLETLSFASKIIAQGEVMQLSQSFDINLNSESYLNIIKAKTAALFAASTKVGAIISSVNQDNIEHMYNYGINLGSAFQIVDDIIDYNPNSGKTYGNDFYEGKITLPIINAYKSANFIDRSKIKALFAKSERTALDLEEILAIIAKTDAINHSYELANSYTNNSIDSLSKLEDVNISVEILTILRDTSMFLINRKI